MSQPTNHKAICRAMRAAGITDADSATGKQFCTEKCPYETGCVVFENLPNKSALDDRAAAAKELHLKGLSVEEIAVKMRKNLRTIQRYLKER